MSHESREIRQAPRASAIITSLRAIGYSFNTAIADIIDNSIAASASEVDVSFDTDPSWVAIIDNGCGMTEVELVAAMRHGADEPNANRRPTDLGRYGLGLKTASLSQCRRLTVVSLKYGELSAAIWDLSEVERRDDWIIILPSQSEILALPQVTDLLRKGQGTLVLWEDFDRAMAGESDPAAALQALVLACGKHLGLVFHRYLAPEYGKALKIAVNRRPVELSDPFLRNNPFTEFAGEESKTIDGQTIEMKAFILPHISKLTASELESAGGKDHLRDTQGFYVYRNRRLITWGTWFGLLSRDELTRLARVRIDIPNALDHLWALDVKKSTATPPAEVRKVLKQIIHTVADQSKRVFRERRRGSQGGVATHLWERSLVREGIRYSLNREHPLLRTCAEKLSPADCAHVDRILTAIELALPVRAIYVDQASNETIDQGDSTIVKLALVRLLDDLLGEQATDRQRTATIESLQYLEPFSNFPQATRSMLESLNKT